jgi:tRNA wybutosine-synthesizing protein 4
MARFGASVVNHQSQTWVVGGIIKNEILDESREFHSIDTELRVSRVELSKPHGFAPRPLLIGSSIFSVGKSLVVMGGSAVCFSFGTSWNKGCYTLQVVDRSGCSEGRSPVEVTKSCWGFMYTAARLKELHAEVPPSTGANPVFAVPRVKVGSADDFAQIAQLAKPVIVEGLNLGPCTKLWTSDYLKETIGTYREVSQKPQALFPALDVSPYLHLDHV